MEDQNNRDVPENLNDSEHELTDEELEDMDISSDEEPFRPLRRINRPNRPNIFANERVNMFNPERLDQILNAIQNINQPPANPPPAHPLPVDQPDQPIEPDQPVPNDEMPLRPPHLQRRNAVALPPVALPHVALPPGPGQARPGISMGEFFQFLMNPNNLNPQPNQQEPDPSNPAQEPDEPNPNPGPNPLQAGGFVNLLDMMMGGMQAETEEDQMNREICDSHMVDYIKNMRNELSAEEEYKEYKEEEFKYDSITTDLARMVVTYWQDKGDLPTTKEHLEDLSQFCAEYKYRNRPCQCLLDNWHDEEKKKVIYEIVKKRILDVGEYPSCGIMSNMLSYHTLNKKLPTKDEFREYLEHQIEFSRDPEQYFLNHKHQLPTANLSLLKPKEYDGEESKTCGICYNDIEKGTMVMELPCGGKHVFHLEESECLEGLTIKKWLESNKVCPMCKDEIVIKDEEKENEETN